MIFGVGIHILIAIFFAVHVVRTGRELYWLIILFSFPLLGSVIYFFAVFLPQSRLDHGLRKAGAAVARNLDPGRELREARQAYDMTPTAQNQMRLANALLDAGRAAEAVEQYAACLRGPFANDVEINFGAARAYAENGQPGEALKLLTALRAREPNFRVEQIGLLMARSYRAAGMEAEAGAELSAVVERFGSIESRVEHALWALDQGESAVAAHELKEIEHARKHMTRHTLSVYADLFRRLDAACARGRSAG